MDIFINIFDLRQQKWVPYDSHLKKYINITGINYSTDFVNEIFNQTQVEFKPCDEKEVLKSKSDQYKKVWNNLMNIYTDPVCIDNTDEIYMQGHTMEFTEKRQRISTFISKCRGPTCEQNQTLFEQTIAGMFIGIDGVFQSINFKERG